MQANCQCQDVNCLLLLYLKSLDYLRAGQYARKGSQLKSLITYSVTLVSYSVCEKGQLSEQLEIMLNYPIMVLSIVFNFLLLNSIYITNQYLQCSSNYYSLYDTLLIGFINCNSIFIIVFSNPIDYGSLCVLLYSLWVHS